MFVLSVLEAPNTKTNSLCVQTHLAIKLFLILMLWGCFSVAGTEGLIRVEEKLNAPKY